MLKVNLFSVKGVKKETVVLPKEIAGENNPFLVAQSFRVYTDNMHFGNSRTKTRAEVNATGAKVWKQKGTGNARHGSKKAPIFVGGGKAHGPKGVKRVLKLPAKMRRLALASAINLKAKMGHVVLAEKIGGIKKTKEAHAFVSSVMSSQFPGKKERKILLVVSAMAGEAVRAFKNIKKVSVSSYKNLDAGAVLTSGLVIVDNSIFEVKRPKKVSGKKLDK